jgi:hypothetical protein
MRFCNLNTRRSSLRQTMVFHSLIELPRALDISIAIGTFSVQLTVPTSAYP